MRSKTFLLLWLIAASPLFAQSDNTNAQNLRITPLVSGTLMIPDVESPPLVILIAGSGPTDRDGNQQEADFDGLLAVCVQHEMDHLEGVVILDKVSRLKRSRYLKKAKKAGTHTVLNS